jgi:phage terminase large subunit-like protein
MADACLPWAFDLPRALFGAYDAESGRRLIRFFFEFVAKKNAKSTVAAAIMVTALMRNWRHSGEFYILAPTKEIADNSFFPARDMVRADDELRQILHVQENFRTITHRNTNAFLKVVAADSETVGGKKTIGLLIDELWLFGKRANADAMIREASGGLASRPEGFVIYLSTQSDTAPTGVFAQKLEEFRAIRDGKIEDPRSLPILYEFPRRLIDSGEYRLPKNYFIPNPNLGKSVDEEFLTDELTKSERAGKASLINAEAKYLNVQVGMALRADGWAGALVWDRGIETGLTLEALLERSDVVTIGIDGGGLDDLLGIGIIGREKGTRRWLGWMHALISDIGIERRKANAENYDQFEAAGDLTKFVYAPPQDGAGVQLPENIRFIIDLVARVQALGLLAQVGVDAAGIGVIVDALAEIGVTQDAETLDAVRQGIALMGAIKTIEIKLADYSFRHDGSELGKWCVGNLRVVPTPTAMRVARDESGFGKVDPAMALFNAAHLMTLNPEAGRSVYDQLADDEAVSDPGEGLPSPDEDRAILGNPAHPLWQAARERFEARLSQQDDDL